MSEGHKEICKIFASGKYCKFEKHCRYLHFRPPNLKSAKYQDESLSKRNLEGAVAAIHPSEFVESTYIARDGNLNSTSLSSEHRYKSSFNQSYQSGNYEASKVTQKLKKRGPRSDFHKSTSQEVVNSHARVENESKKECSFFSKFGRCRYGEKCRYVHSLPSSVRQNVNKFSEERQDDHDVRGNVSDQAVTVCRFYAKGYCRYGNRCKASHTIPEDRSYKGKGKTSAKEPDCKKSIGSAKRPIKPVATFRPPVQQFIFKLDSLSNAEERQKLRDTELNLFKKRYPKSGCLDDGNTFEFVFSPTDPDWPYDIKSVELKVSFPIIYPVECFKIELLENVALPNTLRRYIWKSIEEWIDERFTKLTAEANVELMFRPFLKWLDKSLEELFTTGLKLYQKELIAQAAGIQLVPASELQEKFQQHSLDSDETEEDSDQAEDDGEDYGDSEESDQEEDVLEENLNRKSSALLDPAKRGTEVKLHNLQLQESAATLSVQKVHLILQCDRCKSREELITPTERVNATQCAKCLQEQLVTFRANLAHQFTNIIGYLDVQGCAVFDMILAECNFKTGCLKCSTEALFGNLPPGQPKDTWCHNCHAKLRVAADCAKFLQLQPSVIEDAVNVHNVGLKKGRKPPKDPAIQEGKPLPNNGTCKHYKKSFRWLRFPCCGKTYPCDVCHEDNEDHEMKFASRMICGYCAKEQPFAGDRPCKSCDSYLVKKFTEHWEGGKGCRDKIRMSTGDKKKYANLSKTISRKSQAKKTSGEKKKTYYV